MALSDKHEGKILVPWFCSDEWKYVYNLIYSESSTKQTQQAGLDILKIWKTRTPLLSSGVEGTLIILSALLLEDDIVSREDVCLVYAASIMRFLNLCAANSKKQGTFYETARKHKLPDWLIDIRHDLAHHQRIPSKFILQFSLDYCLKWLKREYWEVQDKLETDLVSECTPEEVTSEVPTYILIYCDIATEAANGNSETLSDLSKECVDKLDVLIRSKFIKEDTHIPEILSLLCKLAFRTVFDTLRNISAENIAATIVNHEGFFTFFGTNNNNDNHALSLEKYFKLWEIVFINLNEHNMLDPFIKLLIRHNVEENGNAITRKLCGLWLGKVFNGFLKVISGKSKNTNTSNGFIKFNHIDKNVFTNLQFYQDELLKHPHSNTLTIVKPVMLLNKCSPSFMEAVELLVSSYTVVKNQDSVPEAMCTEETVNQLFKHAVTNDETVSEKTSEKNNVDREFSTKRWQLVEDTSIFKGCPIGVLPHQNRSRNPTLNYLF